MHRQVSPQEQCEVLSRGIVDLHSRDELLLRLKLGRPLRVKAGFDPTRPDLHLGHTVVLSKMRQFQDFGHEILFIVGDFTAQIGDPSGRNATRPPATREQIEEGARSYAAQALKVLDKERTRIVFNGAWLNPMTFADAIRLAGKYTLARMMERDDFKRRWEEHASIGLHELLYPLVQGYDSIELKADVELGGTDQLFNLLVGRELMRESGLPPQIVMTLPILEGLNARVENGKLVGDKMSKSLDNYVGVDEPPGEMFGKLMSISDDLMWRYYDVLSRVDAAEIAARRARAERGELNPRDAKFMLAEEIVGRYHTPEQATAAKAAWVHQFSERQRPTDMPEVRVQAVDGAIWLAKALVEAKFVPSSAEGRRRIEQGAVEVDEQRVRDIKATLAKGGRYVVRAGKRAWAVIVVE